MARFRLVVKNKAESNQYEIPIQSGVLTTKLNDFPVLQVYIDFAFIRDMFATYNVTVADVFTTGFAPVYLYEDDVLIFGGMVGNVRYKKYERDFNIELTCLGWLAYFTRRYYSGEFSGTDAEAIAWTALNNVNDIGITRGTNDTTVSRDRNYGDWDVHKIITHLTNTKILNGFEMEITPQKVFSVKSSLGTVRNNIIFDDFNIIKYDIDVDTITRVTNRGIILGDGSGEDQLRRTYNAGASFESDWYVLEDLLSETAVKETDTLDDKVEDHVEKNKVAVFNGVLTAKTDKPDVNSYAVGDTVKLDLNEISYTQSRRIVEKSYTFGDRKTEVRLRFDEQ